MRTEAEIKATMKLLRRKMEVIEQATVRDAARERLNKFIEGVLCGLHWALGHDKGTHYFWCVGCQWWHRGLRCPVCGNKKEIGCTTSVERRVK